VKKKVNVGEGREDGGGFWPFTKDEVDAKEKKKGLGFPRQGKRKKQQVREKAINLKTQGESPEKKPRSKTRTSCT